MSTWVRAVTFTVLGTPAPKGSSRAMIKKGKGGKPMAVNVPSGSNANRDAQRSWRADLILAASQAIGDVTVPPFVGVAIRMKVEFRLKRPAGHYSKATGLLLPSAPEWPIVKPDKDKLMRATKDALKGLVFDDDSRVCESFERKVYADPGKEGAWIRIETLPGRKP